MALRHRIGGKIAAIRREHPGLQITEEVRHLAALLLLRDDLMAALDLGSLEPQRLRAVTETNRQIESVGARLGVFSPQPKAGEPPRPRPARRRTSDDYLNPTRRPS